MTEANNTPPESETSDSNAINRKSWRDKGSLTRYFIGVAAMTGATFGGILVGANVIAGSLDDSVQDVGEDVKESVEGPMDTMVEYGKETKQTAEDVEGKFDIVSESLGIDITDESDDSSDSPADDE